MSSRASVCFFTCLRLPTGPAPGEVVVQEYQRVHDVLGETVLPKFSCGEFAVLQNIVQEPADHLLVIGPGYTEGKGMKDGGTTIEVLRESLRQLFDCSEMINRIHY